MSTANLHQFTKSTRTLLASFTISVLLALPVNAMADSV